MLEAWMSFIGVSWAFGTIPQIIRLRKRKSSDDISIILWLIGIHAQAWWLYYGIVTGSIAIILTDCVAIALDGYALILILLYRSKR